MGKLTTYILIMSGLMLLFYFSGLLPEGTVSNTLLSMLLNPGNLKNSPIGLDSDVLFTGVMTAGLVIGYLLYSNVELGITAIFVLAMGGFLWDFTRVYNVVYLANPVIAILLFSPVMLLFIITLIEWWRGRD